MSAFRYLRLSAVIRTCAVLGFLALSLAPAVAQDIMRFPAPEFESGYDFPATTTPPPVMQIQEYGDVIVLLAALVLATIFDLKMRSRRALFWLMVFSLGYFGFYREGCVCPIGSIQNVAQSIFDPNYAVPISVLLFFLLPLIFAGLFGRVFCASVCPLGAIQDLVLLKPIKIHAKISQALSTIPYIYMGTAVLLAATGSAYIICRFDPFIGFFRLDGNAPYLYLGAIFLIVGIFIGRPYCRFFCPYGVLLGWMSRFSKWHLSITPTECVQCRLCEDSCPFDYINKPNTGLAREERTVGVRRLGWLVVALPLMILLGGWVGRQAVEPLSRVNRHISLAEQVLIEREQPNLEPTLATKTFRSQGKPESQLLEEATALRKKMNIGGWILGAFIGLAFGIKLIEISTNRHRRDYEVDKTKCFSCGRCYPACPSDDMHKPNFLEV